MKFLKTLIIFILIFLTMTLVFLYFSKNKAIKASADQLQTDQEDWQIFHNASYGYDMMCSKDFDCRYICKSGDMNEEQFCANKKDDPENYLKITQIPVKSIGNGKIIIDFAGNQFVIDANTKTILNGLKNKLTPDGAQFLAGDKFNITGVAEIMGFSKKDINNNSQIEQWFFVKNDFLYIAKISVKLDGIDFPQKLRTLEDIFGTMSF